MLLVVGEIDCEEANVEIIVYNRSGLGVSWFVFEEVEVEFGGAWDWWLWGGICSFDENEWLYED